MSLEDWRYVTGGIAVLLWAVQIVMFAKGGTLSRGAQACILMFLLVLALETLIP